MDKKESSDLEKRSRKGKLTTAFLFANVREQGNYILKKFYENRFGNGLRPCKTRYVSR